MALSKIQAAQTLGISVSTLDRLMRAGSISYHRIGTKRVVFTTEDLTSFLDTCKAGKK